MANTGGNNGKSDRLYFLWKKSYDKPRQRFKKQRHHFADKCPMVKAMVFPVVTYGCESWTVKKAEHWRIDAFELWCWRRFVSIPCTARRSNQSVLKEINTEHSLEGLILKLRFQYFGYLMLRAHWLENTLMLRKTEGKRRSWRQRMRWLNASWTPWMWIWATLGDSGRPRSLACYCRKELDTA